jgi:hypothetical protein
MVQFQKAQRLLRGIGFTKNALVSLARSLARLASASGKVGRLAAAIQGIPENKCSIRDLPSLTQMYGPAAFRN